MANVTINNIGNLNNDVLELKSKVNNSLNSNIDSLNSILNSFGNYINNGFSVNVGSASKALKTNYENILNNMTNATENIFNYASYINEFNVNDYDANSKAVDLSEEYNGTYLNIVDENDKDDKNNKDKNKKNENSNSNSNNNSNNNTNNNSNNGNGNGNNNKPTSNTETGNTEPNKIKLDSSVILIEDADYSNNFEDNVLEIINNVSFDNEGFAKLQDRYVVCMNESYGKVGDLIDIKQSNGTTLNCIIGLTQTETTDTINFFVNQETFVKPLNELHPKWLKNITKIDTIGNYFSSVK